MQLFFKKGKTNGLKDNREDPIQARKRQLEEEAKQLKFSVRQEFQKLENNAILDQDLNATSKFEFKNQVDQIYNINEQRRNELVELKRILNELVESNKVIIRPKSRQWNGYNTFELTELQNNNNQKRPHTSQSQSQIRINPYSKNKCIPEYFSVALNKNSSAVENRLQNIKDKYLSTQEQIFIETQKQSEIMQMTAELRDKDKRIKEKLYGLKRMIKLAESRYSNVERIEYHAAENKKHIKRNVLNAKNELQETQKIEDAFLEQKKYIHKELKKEIVLQEDLLQHNYIKLQEYLHQNEEVKKQLEDVISDEYVRKEKENEFYILGQNLWAIQNLQKQIEQEQQRRKQSESTLIENNSINNIKEKRQSKTLDQKITNSPSSQSQQQQQFQQNRRRTVLDSIYGNGNKEKSLQSYNYSSSGSQTPHKSYQSNYDKRKSKYIDDPNKQNFSAYTSNNNNNNNNSPPKLTRNDILSSIDSFFTPGNNINEVTEMIIKEFHDIDLENEMKEIMYKNETQQKMKLTADLQSLSLQLNELLQKNEFLLDEQDQQDQINLNANININKATTTPIIQKNKEEKQKLINNLLEQDIAMDAGRIVINKIQQQNEQKQEYNTINQTIFSCEESQKIEIIENQVKQVQQFLVLLFLSAKEFITRVICIVQRLQEKCSDKFQPSINIVNKEICHIILGKLPHEIIPTKKESNQPIPSLIFDNTTNNSKNIFKSQVSMEEIIENNMKLQSSLSSLNHIEDLELIDVTNEIQDEKLKSLCKEFLDNMKKQSLLKYFVQSSVVSNHLKRLSQIYFQNPTLAVQKFQQFEELKQSAQLQIRIRFRIIFDSFIRLYQSIERCRDESSQQIKLMKQYFSLNSGERQINQNGQQSIIGKEIEKMVRFENEQLIQQQSSQQESEFNQQQRLYNSKIIDKINNYQNSNEDDYYQKFGKMDMLNEQRRVHQEMIESEQEKKSKAIMRFITSISEKKKSISSKSSQSNDLLDSNNLKSTDNADDKEYLNKQRLQIKKLEDELKNNANKKSVKKSGFFSKELGFNSKPIEVYDRISKRYDKNELVEHQNIKQIATESSILFKIDQLDSRYTGQEEKKISQEFHKQKKDKIVFYKKEFQQISHGYQQLNSLYHTRKKLSSMTIQNLKNMEFEKNIMLYSKENKQQSQSQQQLRPQTTSSQSQSQQSQLYNMKNQSQMSSSIMSRKSDQQIKNDSLTRKKLNAVLLAQQLNNKLIQQGILKNNKNNINVLDYASSSKGEEGQTAITKSYDSISSKFYPQFNDQISSNNYLLTQDKKNDYFLSQTNQIDFIHE